MRVVTWSFAQTLLRRLSCGAVPVDGFQWVERSNTAPVAKRAPPRTSKRFGDVGG
jgi:hypothetical protein